MIPSVITDFHCIFHCNGSNHRSWLFIVKRVLLFSLISDASCPWFCLNLGFFGCEGITYSFFQWPFPAAPSPLLDPSVALPKLRPRSGWIRQGPSCSHTEENKKHHTKHTHLDTEPTSMSCSPLQRILLKWSRVALKVFKSLLQLVILEILYKKETFSL